MHAKKHRNMPKRKNRSRKSFLSIGTEGHFWMNKNTSVLMVTTCLALLVIRREKYPDDVRFSGNENFL